MAKPQINYVWKDRKRTLFGLPWSFTKYCLTEEKFLTTVGCFTQQEEEVRLYRIVDVTLKRTLRDRIWKVGTIHCCSGDHTTPEFNIKRIKNPVAVKEMLSDMVEEARNSRGVGIRETLNISEDSDLDDFATGTHNAERRR